MGMGERKPYGGNFPKCTKCHFHHNGPCTQKCHKCNKVGHFARNCRKFSNTNVANTQKGNGENPKGNDCFECGAPGHFKRDCPELKNKDRGNGECTKGWVVCSGNAGESKEMHRGDWTPMSVTDIKGPYHTNLPTPEEIHQFLQFQRVDSNRKIKNKNVILSPNQVLTKELRRYLKRWNELIYENVFGLGGHRDHLPACLAHILYCILAEQQYNLTYFFVKRIESAQETPKAHLPYGMFLTRLFRHVMELYPHLDNGIYNVVNHVMRPLALKQTRRPRSDRGKARHSVSLNSAHHNLGSSSRHEDDDEDDGVSRASTPSPTTYLNSLKRLNFQQYKIPFPSGQNLTQEDTKTPSPKHQLSSPSAPNAPSKTPSTKGTSSSSIDYTPKSPTSSISPSTNGYLNSPTSSPIRVPLPPPTQENASMDITLTLSPITLLDV
ncbi:ribosomal protein L7Ae/L30e/S12e/Gadd45 [Tanacetum coccineum]